MKGIVLKVNCILVCHKTANDKTSFWPNSSVFWFGANITCQHRRVLQTLAWFQWQAESFPDIQSPGLQEWEHLLGAYTGLKISCCVAKLNSTNISLSPALWDTQAGGQGKQILLSSSLSPLTTLIPGKLEARASTELSDTSQQNWATKRKIHK